VVGRGTSALVIDFRWRRVDVGGDNFATGENFAEKPRTKPGFEKSRASKLCDRLSIDHHHHLFSL
jgi:hypothetical protein